MNGSEVVLRWRYPVTDEEIFELTSSHGGSAVRGWWDQVRRHSLGWVTARSADGGLIGFVNVAWDGGDHAFLLDTKTHPDHQRRRIGSAVVRLAAQRARDAGCEWLHVDFDQQHRGFYLEACGFTGTQDAGLIHLYELQPKRALMKVRTATTADHDRILTVVGRAFRGGDDEVGIVNDVRRLGAAISDLELVATVEDDVVGHVLTSQADLNGRPVAAVAPLAVDPEWHRRGVGGALMSELIGRVDGQGWPLLALLGNPAYYGRFGFEPAKPLGIVYPPVDSPAFQIRRLTTYDRTWRGTFTYAWEQPQ